MMVVSHPGLRSGIQFQDTDTPPLAAGSVIEYEHELKKIYASCNYFR